MTTLIADDYEAIRGRLVEIAAQDAWRRLMIANGASNPVVAGTRETIDQARPASGYTIGVDLARGALLDDVVLSTLRAPAWRLASMRPEVTLEPKRAIAAGRPGCACNVCMAARLRQMLTPTK